MNADGADCDATAFCHNPRWGAYEGALPAAAQTRASTHSARRMARLVVRELSR